MSPNRSRVKKGDDGLSVGMIHTEAAEQSWGSDHTVTAKREEPQEFPMVQISYLPKASFIVQRGSKDFVLMYLVIFFLSLKNRHEPWMPSLFSKII